MCQYKLFSMIISSPCYFTADSFMEACSPNTGTVLDPFSDHGTRECWELGFAEAYRPENLWSFIFQCSLSRSHWEKEAAL